MKIYIKKSKFVWQRCLFLKNGLPLGKRQFKTNERTKNPCMSIQKEKRRFKGNELDF